MLQYPFYVDKFPSQLGSSLYNQRYLSSKYSQVQQINGLYYFHFMSILKKFAVFMLNTYVIMFSIFFFNSYEWGVSFNGNDRTLFHMLPIWTLWIL